MKNVRIFEEIRRTSIRSDENCDRKHAKNRRFKTLQSAQGLAGTTGRYTSISPHFRSIYKDTFDAFCRQLRFLKGRFIDNRLWIKDDDISLVTAPDQTAIFQLEPASRKGSHLSNRLRQTQPVEFTHVSAKHARIA